MLDAAEKRLYEFKEDLGFLSPIQIVRKHIIFGECCMLSQREYFDLRSEVADHFGLHPNEVLVVGSTKLGFSVAPNKRYRPFRDTSVLMSPWYLQHCLMNFGKRCLGIGMRARIGRYKELCSLLFSSG